MELVRSESVCVEAGPASVQGVYLSFTLLSFD